MFLSNLVVSRTNVLVLEVSCTMPPRSTKVRSCEGEARGHHSFESLVGTT